MTPGKYPPEKPSSMNGDHEALWGFLLHLNSRVDSVIWILLGGVLTLLAAIMGVLAAVLLK